MLVTIEGDFLQHAPLHGTSPAAEVVETLATRGDQPVKRITPHHLEAAADPRPAASDGEIRLIQGLHQFADLSTLDLVVCGPISYPAPGRPLKPRHERGGLTKALGKADDDEIIAARQQTLQRRSHLRPRPIKYHDELVPRIESVEAGLVLEIERGYVARMAIAHGHDHRQGQESGLSIGRRHRWAH